jgi:hypothetical protein
MPLIPCTELVRTKIKKDVGKATNRQRRPELLTFHVSFIRLSGPAGAGNSRPLEMTDVHDKKTRSFNMSRTRSKESKVFCYTMSIKAGDGRGGYYVCSVKTRYA